MTKEMALRQLKLHLSDIKKRFGVTDLALFGSTSRDTAGPRSDIDILVRFDGAATSSRYFGWVPGVNNHGQYGRWAFYT